MMNHESVDRDVRAHVYDTAMRTGLVPPAAAVAKALELATGEVLASFARLAEGRVLVLQRDSGEILMAAPFSAVPTPFVVEVRGFAAYANCIWDGLGIAAALDEDASIRTSCGDCGTAMEVTIESRSVRGGGLVHFAVPARLWWQDIVFT